MQAAIAARAQAATAWERARLNQTAEAARQALVGELHAAARDSAAVDQASQALLRNVLAQADRANTSWFDAVKVSLDLPPSLLARGDGRGMAGKATVGLASLRQHGGTCTAYGAGVRYEGGTELQLARSGCAVHAFDCTMNSSARMHKYLSAFAALPNFAFHPWCLGTAPGRADFMAVDDTMRSLGHRWLDLLKFDIEGHEWDVLDSLLTRAEGDAAAAARLPLQLAFELHTSGVRPCHRPLSACRGTFCCKRVPHMAVGTLLSKGPREVAALFLRLREAGYQVASKEVNVQDRACAEFVVVRVPPPPEAAAPAVADGRGTPSAAPTPARAVAARAPVAANAERMACASIPYDDAAARPPVRRHLKLDGHGDNHVFTTCTSNGAPPLQCFHRRNSNKDKMAYMLDRLWLSSSFERLSEEQKFVEGEDPRLLNATHLWSNKGYMIHLPTMQRYALFIDGALRMYPLQPITKNLVWFTWREELHAIVWFAPLHVVRCAFSDQLAGAVPMWLSRSTSVVLHNSTARRLECTTVHREESPVDASFRGGTPGYPHPSGDSVFGFGHRTTPDRRRQHRPFYWRLQMAGGVRLLTDLKANVLTDFPSTHIVVDPTSIVFLNGTAFMLTAESAVRSWFVNQAFHNVVYEMPGLVCAQSSSAKDDKAGQVQLPTVAPEHRARCFAGTHEPEPYHNATPRYSALDQLPDRPSDGGAAVCGCAQGIERHIPRAARAMEEMAAAFAWARIVVMENDSGDGTLAALHQWAARSPNVTILTERGVMARRSSVYQRMSHCRNLLLSHARKLAPAWVVMYDPDLRTTPSAAGFLSCFSLRPVGWAVCGANTPTSQPYYDLLALRTLDDWMPGDYKSCKRRCPQPVCHGANRVIPNESEPVEVLSLFGGLAIYRFALLDGCWYDEAAQQCEHVAFNRCLRRRNGGRLYINPRLQVQR